MIFSKVWKETTTLLSNCRISYTNFCDKEFTNFEFVSTVANNSYSFWADLLYKWLFLGYDWHPWILIQNAMPTFYINQFYVGYISKFFHNGKMKIHLVIQHLLKHAPFIYCKLANFNKCWITRWILIFPLWKKYEK